MRQSKEWLSKQRQKLLQDAQNKEVTALSLERQTYFIDSERLSNINKAKELREDASKSRQALLRLRSGSRSQKMAGFTQGYDNRIG